MNAKTAIHLAALAAVVLGATVPVAYGQQADPAAAQPARAQSGPLVVERVKSGFVAAPDFKVTDIDNATGELIGGYGGWLQDETFLLGGGGYWLANGPNHTDMWYGGFVVGWYAPVGKAVRFGARGLVGGGEAELTDSFAVTLPPNRPRPFDNQRGMGSQGGQTVYQRFRWQQDFFVFEPQVDVLVRVTDWMRFSGGVGYRVIGAADGFENRLQGVTGSVAVVFGGGS